MADLLLIVQLAGRRVAFPASEVEAVVELEGLTAAPRSAAHVAGLSALRSRVLTVIDAVASLEFGRAGLGGLLEAIVVPSGGHTYALLVDAVEDVVEAAGPPAPVRAPAGPGWDRVALGMVDAGDDLLLLVDPHALIAGPNARAA
ncbi:MAG TPA: chemotaxis protein CheW [Allosphingosinicella sp.]|nr:chemotaxis protein CheW [Allosphingosinicella sp.]